MSRVRGAARLLGSRKHVKVGAQIGFDNQLMTQQFFERPILNSPYAFPGRHWELDDGQPTNRIIDSRRRRSDYFTPVPKPKKRRRSTRPGPRWFRATRRACRPSEQEYNPTPIINEIRTYVETWRNLPNPDHWQVTPETARLLQALAAPPVRERPPVLLPGRGGRDGDLADRSRAEARASAATSSGRTSRAPTSRPTRSCSASP